MSPFEEMTSGYWYLQPTNFIETLEEQDRIALEEIAVCRPYPRGSHIFEAGETSDRVFIALSGRVKIYQISAAGREVIHWFCFPGELLGLADVSKGAPRSSFAEASVDSEIMAIDNAKFLKYMADRPMVALNAIEILSSRLRRLGGSLLDVATGDVALRLGRLVLGLAQTHGHPVCHNRLEPPEVCVKLVLTHQDIADMISASRQTVTTHLNDMRKDGLLHWQDHHIHLDRPDLVAQLVAERAG